MALQAGGENIGHSVHQESSLTQAFGQMTRILQMVDQNSHQIVLAAITTSNENTARIGQLLARNKQPYGGPQRPLITSLQQNPVASMVPQTQPQIVPSGLPIGR